jgi:oxygen-independent coproporphyrinogen-3 oxidase
MDYQSLYLHVPFCRHICDYCALYSVVDDSDATRDAYLQKMGSHLQRHGAELQNLDSIFIGGGTPSALTPEQLRLLLAAVNLNTRRRADCEWTVECNPGSVTAEKIDLLADAGVNRLSFGAQSTTRSTRRVLGRRTGDRELRQALALARAAGFKRLNADLIYGVPGQTLADFQHDLDALLAEGLEHISAYSLILEEGTPLAARLDEVDDALAVEMDALAGEVLGRAGLRRYEISNHARPGEESRHNLGIWLGASYLGLGPAAASFDGRRRWTELADLQAWLQGAAPEEDPLPPEKRAAEVVAFGFRTASGWPKSRLRDLHGTDALSLLLPVLRRLEAEGLLEETAEAWKPTRRGLLFADQVAAELI